MSKKSSTFAPAFEKEQHGGHSSVGRASDCGSECRGFEPHSPPKTAEIPFGIAAVFCVDVRARSH